MIEQLEKLERLANERGVSLTDALKTINIMVESDLLTITPTANMMDEEVYGLWCRLKEVCKVKGYDFHEVVYKVSGNMWGDRG